jgi:hypothetical protein
VQPGSQQSTAREATDQLNCQRSLQLFNFKNAFAPDPDLNLNPYPDPLVRGMDPVPVPDPDFLSASKNSKKNLDSYCFVTFFELFIFEK